MSMLNRNNNFIIRSLIAPCYSSPSFDSSKVTEAVFGECVEVNDTKDDWLYIRQEDGYTSWVKEFYGTFEKSSSSCNYIVLDKHPLPFGSRVSKVGDDFITINGDTYIYNNKPVKILNAMNTNDVLKYARSLLGSPYRWGGKTSGGFDCSGFVQTIFLLLGLLLPRDSGAQSKFFHDSRIDAGKSSPGDLHFFGKDGKVSHVGISSGGFNLIHCQGWVKEESFDNSESGNKKLRDMYMHTCSVSVNLSK